MVCTDKIRCPPPLHWSSRRPLLVQKRGALCTDKIRCRPPPKLSYQLVQKKTPQLNKVFHFFLKNGNASKICGNAWKIDETPPLHKVFKVFFWKRKYLKNMRKCLRKKRKQLYWIKFLKFYLKNGNASKICGNTSKKEETPVADTGGAEDIRPPPDRFREGLSPPPEFGIFCSYFQISFSIVCLRES